MGNNIDLPRVVGHVKVEHRPAGLDRVVHYQERQSGRFVDMGIQEGARRGILKATMFVAVSI